MFGTHSQIFIEGFDRGELSCAGSRGDTIVRGRGESIGWQNRTLFRPDDPLLLRDLYLEEYYGREYVDSDRVVTLFELCRLLGVESPEALDRPLTRIDAAIIIDTLADPFHSRNIDWTGKLL